MGFNTYQLLYFHREGFGVQGAPVNHHPDTLLGNYVDCLL